METTNILLAGHSLTEGQYLQAEYIYAAVQENGDLFIYSGRNPNDKQKIIWSSNSPGTTAISYYLYLDNYGLLSVMKGTPDKPTGTLWSSKTKGDNGDYFLALVGQHLVVVEGNPSSSGKRIWVSNN